MEIRIGKSARACVACDRAFVHEQELHSLVRIEHQMLQREDYCAECWDPDRGVGAFSLWSAQFYDPRVAEQEPPEVFSPLRQAFYEAVDSGDRAELAKAYLAAQLLRRQKVFRFIREGTDPETEVRVALYSDRFGNALVEVRDPNLTYAEMEGGRRELLARLHDLENPATGDEDEAGGDEPDQDDDGLVREERLEYEVAGTEEKADHA